MLYRPPQRSAFFLTTWFKPVRAGAAIPEHNADERERPSPIIRGRSRALRREFAGVSWARWVDVADGRRHRRRSYVGADDIPTSQVRYPGTGLCTGKGLVGRCLLSVPCISSHLPARYGSSRGIPADILVFRPAHAHIRLLEQRPYAHVRLARRRPFRFVRFSSTAPCPFPVLALFGMSDDNAPDANCAARR
ncbi:hypothetical protein C8R44DRAFT_886794 [Mycena epipterygia]|nr:hypothetical protein C8R44DRAFT_886794 [Mycena epipterygia]